MDFNLDLEPQDCIVSFTPSFDMITRSYENDTRGPEQGVEVG